MPKMHQRHKRKTRTSATGHTGARPIGHLLARAPVLSPIAGQAARQAAWRDWLKSNLPAELTGRVTGVVERDGLLTVFAESAAWSARLRYALQELDQAVRRANPNIKRVAVKVMPGKRP